MNTSAIRHRSTADMCYCADSDTAVIRLCTGRDITQAYIICDDPFIHWLRRQESWDGTKHPMTLCMELSAHLIWDYRTNPPYKRLQYYIEVSDGDKSLLVYDNKICDPDIPDNTSKHAFKLPWMNPSDIISPPEWVKDTVWYQIMPDRFCRAGEPDKRYLEWGKFMPPHHGIHGEFYGGDFKGVTERLPYLHKLGINGIYFTPIFLSDSYHRYNTFDYNVIDGVLGSEDDLKELVRHAHSLGIRVMLDGVFNHCGTEFFAWKDVLQKGRDSEYYDWFFINGDDLNQKRFDTADGRYFTFSFVGLMPKLNTNNPEVINYFRDICSRWVREWDIDGIRFDVGDEVSHTFLRELRRTLKPIKPELFLLGERWLDSLPWLEGDEYDSVMNYPAYDCVNDFNRERGLSSVDFMHSLNACLAMYPEQVTEVLFNFIDTHDTIRVSEECKGDVDLLLQKLSMLFTLPGTPCIYYGTEIALRGREKWENRSCMPWDMIDSGEYDKIFSDVSSLIRLRREYPQLKGISMEFIHYGNNPRILHYLRSDQNAGSKIAVCLNCGSEDFLFTAQGKVLFSRLYDNGIMKPQSTVIYEIGG